MRTQLVLLAAALGVVPMLLAQRGTIPVVSVKATSKGERPVAHSAVIMNAICDDVGTVYSRPFDPQKGREAVRAPLVATTSGAKAAGIISIADVLPEGSGSRTFAIHNGRVYMPVVTKKGELYVMEFSQDGVVKAQAKLALDFFVDVFHLAVFKTGEYLVVGLTGSRVGTSPHLRTPFTAVFAADGRQIRKIYEPEDEDARQRAEEGDPKYLLCCSTSGNEFVQFNADAVPGADGNIYLLHGTSPPLIYVISPEGEVLRKLRIPVGHPDLTANSIRFYNGRLAIGFGWLGDTPQSSIKVVDLMGNSIVDYQVEEQAGDSDPILACYNANGITLVPRWAGTKPYLLTAKLP